MLYSIGICILCRIKTCISQFYIVSASWGFNARRSDMMCIGETCLKTNDDTYLKKFKLMLKFDLRPILITFDMSKLANKINYLTKTIANSLTQEVFIR